MNQVQYIVHPFPLAFLDAIKITLTVGVINRKKKAIPPTNTAAYANTYILQNIGLKRGTLPALGYSGAESNKSTSQMSDCCWNEDDCILRVYYFAALRVHYCKHYQFQDYLPRC